MRYYPVGGGQVKAEPIPVKVVSPPARCDADHACDWAKFRVIIAGVDLHFCSHHFREHALEFFKREYEVIEL